MQRTSKTDAWIWVFLAFSLVTFRLYPSFIPELGHDSFQYLSGADNALAGRIGYTSLIHYDVERSFGVLPAPMMTFPSGYSLAIAGVSLVGVSTQTAALLISALSVLGCVLLLAWLSTQLNLSRAIRNVVVACFVINGIVSQYSIAALSEPLFMFLELLGVALLVRAQSRNEVARWPYWLTAGLALGSTYFVRYAGLFLIVGLALVFLRHLIARDKALLRGYAIALGAASPFVIAGIARNIMLVGNWRGRGDMLVNNPLLSVIGQTVGTINGLILGVGTAKNAIGGTFVPKIAFAVSLIVGVAILGWNRSSRSAERAPGKRGIGIDILLILATYVACMIYAAHTSSISYGAARHFLPILPLAILLLGLLLSSLLATTERATPRRRVALIALAISFSCYTYLNLLVIRKPRIDEEAVVAEQFSADSAGADVARTAILSLTGPNGAIFANNGQAVGYFLGRPTISTVNSEFSGIIWDEETVRATIRQFHIAAVVITTPVEGQSSDEADFPSPFLRQLSQGTTPKWLTLQQRSSHVLTYAPVLTSPQ